MGTLFRSIAVLIFAGSAAAASTGAASGELRRKNAKAVEIKNDKSSRAPRRHDRHAAACIAQAGRLRVKIPPGACEDPGSNFRIRMLAAARELCEKDRMHSESRVKCLREQQSDK